MAIIKVLVIIGIIIIGLLAIILLAGLVLSIYFSIPYDEWVEMQKKNRKTKRGRG